MKWSDFTEKNPHDHDFLTTLAAPFFIVEIYFRWGRPRTSVELDGPLNIRDLKTLIPSHIFCQIFTIIFSKLRTCLQKGICHILLEDIVEWVPCSILSSIWRCQNIINDLKCQITFGNVFVWAAEKPPTYKGTHGILLVSPISIFHKMRIGPVHIFRGPWLSRQRGLCCSSLYACS